MTNYCIQQAIEEVNQAFEAFKEANDSRLKALEKKTTDPLAEQTLHRLNQFLEGMEDRTLRTPLACQRPELSSAPWDGQKKAFLEYLCTGKEEGTLQQKRMGGNQEEGGVFLPEPMVSAIFYALEALSPMREFSHIVQTANHRYDLVLDDGKNSTQWGEELTPEQKKEGTRTPHLSKISYPIFTLFDSPRISSTLLEDSLFNIEEWLVALVSKNMARQENYAFIRGDGQKMPQGILHPAVSVVDKEESGKLHTYVTGVKGDFGSEKPENILIQLAYGLRPEYLRGAKWMMPRSVIREIRKMRTEQGHYLWQPTFASATPETTLLGYPVIICDDLPELKSGVSSLSLLFGNFKEGYLIADRMGMTVLRDPYSSKPDIDLLIRRRLGGGWRDHKAIKALSFSESLSA